VINSLIDNRVPPEWVDHSYHHGVLILNGLYSGSPLQRGLLDPIDNERLARLHIYGEPAPIPTWGGWRYPDNAEVQELHDIMAAEEDQTVRHPVQGPSYHPWLIISQNGAVEYLTHRSQASASQYVADHPVSLPYYAELEATSSTVATTATAPSDGNPSVEPATMDVDTAVNTDSAHPSGATASPSFTLAPLSLDADAVTDTSGDPPGPAPLV
jgi:hypothetical protein